MTATEFLNRLSRTSIGTTLVEMVEQRAAEGKESLEAVIGKIEARYDEIAAAASEWMKNSSAVMSLLVGIGLAFWWNIDGIKILQFYMANPSLAVMKVESAQKILDGYEATQQALKGAQDEALDEAERKKRLKALEEKVAASRKSYEAENIPIGWEYFPIKAGTNCMDENRWPKVVCLVDRVVFRISRCSGNGSSSCCSLAS